MFGFCPRGKLPDPSVVENKGGVYFVHLCTEFERASFIGSEIVIEGVKNPKTEKNRAKNIHHKEKVKISCNSSHLPNIKNE